MQAVILAGGKGKRLKEITGDAIPKSMVEIVGKPFLEHYINWLAGQGVQRLCLAVGYKADIIESHFGRQFAGVEICYSHEEQPLGTGGAMKQALCLMQQDEPCFVSNGDSFMSLDIKLMLQAHQRSNAQLTVALTKVEDCSKGGQAMVDEATGMITKFSYPGHAAPGYMSMGAYMLQSDIFKGYDLEESFSFEADFKHPHCAEIRPFAYISEGGFLDIGTPETYELAEKYIKSFS